jgi:NADPH-dependent 2,4-dienoyl-CoA reductase/sulfur reductase-like enzyme
MQTSDPDIYAIGDMIEIPNSGLRMSNCLPLSGTASLQGRLAVDHIMKRATPYRGHIGIFTFKVRNVTAAIVGPSVEKLK